MLVHKYVDENGGAAVLASKRSADVTPDESQGRYIMHATAKGE